jgi:hypothetical protein
MKVCIFTDSTWALGQVARDLKSSLKDYDVDIVDWSGHSQEAIRNMYNHYDVIITNIAGKFLLNHLSDKRKILFRADGTEEFGNSGNLEVENTYSATSESIMQFFPSESKVFWTPNGADPIHYTHTLRDGSLKKIGWCGAPNCSVKQIGWALEIAKQSNIPFSITSAVACEQDINLWKPLTHEQVCEWYSTIDLLLITSVPNASSETGPLPAFEAILSGIPVIGTPTGNFAKVPGPKFTTVEEGLQIVKRLECNPDELVAIAKEQYEYVMKYFTYDAFAYRWKEAIEYVHNLSKDSRN